MKYFKNGLLKKFEMKLNYVIVRCIWNGAFLFKDIEIFGISLGLKELSLSFYFQFYYR